VTLDPQDLLERLREAASGGGPDSLLVTAAPGGLLAPLTADYSVRDFARDIGAPLVIAARAAPGCVNDVRLAVEAAGMAALPVAAVVLSHWPDEPGRVLLDERSLVEETAGIEVVALPDSARTAAPLAEAARGWDISGWIEVAADELPDEQPSPPAEKASPEGLSLDPYESWRAHVVGDPRDTPRPRIMEDLLGIVAAEGPMTASRAYALYNRASGGRKLTTVARGPLSSAAHWLAKEEKLSVTTEADAPWQGDDVLRMPDAPAVRLRELGPRTLEEVPLDEIAELIRRIRTTHRIDGDAALKRAVLSTYGLKRLTGKADDYLGLALDLSRG
jgi:hypothetical protein